MKSTRLTTLLAVVAVAIAVLAVMRLEAARDGVEIEHQYLGDTPATVYRGKDSNRSLVIVSHGFAGSRQMMESISLTLANSGHTVVSFDYLGHGRNRRPLSPDIHTLTGTTEDLVRQTLDVVEAARQLTAAEEIALVGHSMATDVVVRAAARLPEVETVVAISMYSEAVTSQHPKRLLIVSGAHETRLREVALDAVGQVGQRVEGQTVTSGDVERRAVAAPRVGHVGVLWADLTSREIAGWLGNDGNPAATGLWIAVLLGAIVVAFWPISMILPEGTPTEGLPLRSVAMALLLATPTAFVAGLSGLPLLGLSGFGTLALCAGIWGGVVLGVLRPRLSFGSADVWAALALLVWGLGCFATVMDHYAAAFLPTDGRISLLTMLLPSTIAFTLADRMITQGHHLLIRVLLRLPFLVVLAGAMVLDQDGIGMLFTVLPVLVLFFLVYGTMAAWAARHGRAVGASVAAGVILAWSISASTPLFAVP